jgi:hypothetical protein
MCQVIGPGGVMSGKEDASEVNRDGTQLCPNVPGYSQNRRFRVYCFREGHGKLQGRAS